MDNQTGRQEFGQSEPRTFATVGLLIMGGMLVGCGSSRPAGTGGQAGTVALGEGGTAGSSSTSGHDGAGSGGNVAGSSGPGAGGVGAGGIGLGDAGGLGGRGGSGGIAGNTGPGDMGGSDTGGADGGVAIGPGCVARTPGQWQLTSTVDEPSPDSNGAGQILWSGKALFVINYNIPGGKYDPCLDVWKPFPGRTFNKLVLASSDGAFVSTVGTPVNFLFFDFTALAWRELSIDGYPTAADAGGTAALVGGKLIRWGGGSPFGSPYPPLANTGATYDPATDRWQAMSTTGAPAERVINGNYAAASSRLFVWGGARTYPSSSPASKDDPTATAMTKSPGLVCPGWDPYECSYGDGALYDPATDRWTPVTQSGAPAARYGHLTAWTGTRVLVWGGARYVAEATYGTTFESLLDGALYDPATDSWTQVAAPPPALQPYGTTSWSDGLMTVSNASLPGGGKYTYDPAKDRWATASPSPTMPARPDGPSQPTVFWTGSYWIAFGGYRSGATPPNPCLTIQPPPTTGCDPPGPERIAVSEAAVALPVP